MDDPPAPAEAEIIARAKADLDLDLPPECVAGVIANLAVVAEHARRIGE